MKLNKKILAFALLGVLALSLLGFSLGGKVMANAATPQQSPVSTQVTVPANNALQNATPSNTAQNSITQSTEDKENAIAQGNANETLEQEEKAAGVEAEQDENLPGGGHQDPEGVEVDHQFEGIE